MTLSLAEVFLIVWAVMATFLSVTRGVELRGLKGFIAQMVSDPKLYNDLRDRMKGAQS